MQEKRRIVLTDLMTASIALANKADTEQEAGVTSDAQGRFCTYGQFHDECLDQYIKNVPTSTEYKQGYKMGLSDGRTLEQFGQTVRDAINVIDKHPYDFYEGWLDGFCSENPNIGSDADEFTFSCDQSRTGAH
jgi:hypothetical protein